MSERATDLYMALRRIVLLVAGLLVLLWFLFEIREVVLLFLFATSLAVVINSPVAWLNGKGVPRMAALFMVLVLILVVLALLGWILVPRLIGDLTTLTQNLPGYIDSLRDRFLSFLSQYPGLQQNLGLDAAAPDAGLPSLGTVLRPLGRYSLSLLGWVTVLLFLTSVVVYMVAYPIPLLEAYQQLWSPRQREPATQAFIHASEMIVGWIRANVIAGALEAVIVSVFLTILNVPAALVWGALAFFAELVPRLGLYLMAIPPILVALSVDPLKAVWVALFYVVLDQTMGNLVLPRVQQQTMDLHPVLLLFAILALAAAFGLVGALLATPLAAIVKAYYVAFYVEQRPQDPDLADRVQRMLHVEVPSAEPAAEEG
jgi:predicted PurR-regulated permease PerM